MITTTGLMELVTKSSNHKELWKNSTSHARNSLTNMKEQDKVLLVQAQANGKILHEEELAFLADLGIAEGQATQTVITHNAAYQADDLDVYDLIVIELNISKVAIMGEFIHLVQMLSLRTEITNVAISSLFSVCEESQRQCLNSNRLPTKDALILSFIVIPDSKETLMLAEESRSKKVVKTKQDPMVLEKKNSINSLDPNPSDRPTKVEVPKEIPKVSMVNTSLKKLKHHLVGFDVIVKERTMTTAITEDSWGTCSNYIRNYLIDELSEVQNVFIKWNRLVEQHPLESKNILKLKWISSLHENTERLLEQVINNDIVNIIMNSSVDIASVNVNECEKCLKLETELLNKKDFVEKEIYDKLFKSFTTLEKHCISLEVDTQLNQEIFQRDNSVSNQSAPSFDQLFELNELKAQSQEKDTVIKKLKERIKTLSGKMNEDKIKKDLEEIETINIELDHRVSKLIAENEHLKQTYKQLYDSIKPARKSFGNYSSDDLRKHKGKSLVDNVVMKHTIEPEMLKIDVEPITPKLLNKRTAHSAYIKHTQEEAAVLRDLVEHVKSKYPLDHSLESACRYAKLIQELLTHISKTCPSINNYGEQLVAMTLKNKNKRVRFTEPVTSSGNKITKIASTSNLVSNKPILSSTGVKPSTSASGSQPSCNTKKNKNQQTPSSTQNNKVEAHLRKVKSSLKNKDCFVEPKGTAHVQHSNLNANFEIKCVKCNGCMLSDNHDLCVLDFINNVNARNKSKSIKKSSKRKVWKPTGKVFTNIGYIWRPTGQTFTIVGNACPLTRITTTTEVPLRKPTALENETPKPVVTLVYSRKPRKSKTNVPVSKSKVVQIVLWYLDSGCSKHMTGDRSQLTNFVNKFLGTVKFGNDHVAKILGYGDYQIGNVTISRVYYVEGLGHNLFSVGQFCDLNLEVAFRQHTCFIHNLEGVDLLTGSRGNNLYTLSLGDMMASSPICLLSKASKTKSWLWHRHLSHLNFGAINHLARHGLVRGLPKLKFEKDHLCYAFAMGKSKKKPYKPKSKDTNQEKLYLLYMDLYGPMRVASVNGNKLSSSLSMITLNLHGRIIETIHVDFDELAAMASEQSSSGPVLHEMTPATISSGLVPNPLPSTPFVPPSRTLEVIALIAEVVAPEPAVSTGSPSLTTVDQDAPSPKDNHELDVAHMNNDPFFGIPIPENNFKASSSSDVIPTVVQTAAPNSEHITKWTKYHPLDNIIGELERPVSTRLQLHEQALFSMQEELNEFEHLEVWELVPRPDKVMVITLKWIYKVKLDELRGILKNKARLVARGYRQEEGIDFEESFALSSHMLLT
ncbi:retrovirus-related pol polyprotein from transposon TNT 1-94 [Tanacetum coccineum]